MSDEDDERMDRARRIRNLREGRRGDADEPAEESPPADDEPTDESSVGDDSPGEPTESDDPDDADAEVEDATANADGAGGDLSDGPDDGDEVSDATEPADDKSDTTQSTAEDEPGADGTDPAGDSATESEPDEALSAAQAAAQAASEFEGEGAVSMDVEEAVDDAGGESTDEPAAPAGATVADATVPEEREEETRVLEFRLGDELYCLDITYVEEIVREEAITRVPNTPEYVSGVVDLRGQITTILDPKTAVGIDGEIDDRLILVFDADTFDDHGYIGWLVDEVNQVTPITDSDVKESPIDEPYINGVIERDDKFVIWTSPEMALDVEADE